MISYQPIFLTPAMDKNHKPDTVQNGLTLDCHNYLTNLHHHSSLSQQQGNKNDGARGNNGLRREHITVFTHTPHYISEYSVYRGPNFTTLTGTPITEQPYRQKPLSLEGQNNPTDSTCISEEETVTADIIRSHFCYYIICCGLWCD